MLVVSLKGKAVKNTQSKDRVGDISRRHALGRLLALPSGKWQLSQIWRRLGSNGKINITGAQLHVPDVNLKQEKQ